MRDPRWEAFTDAEIEALADSLTDGYVDSGSPELVDIDPDLTAAVQTVVDGLLAERDARGFDGTCRQGSPFLTDEDDGDA